MPGKNNDIVTGYNDSIAGLGDNTVTSIVCDDKKKWTDYSVGNNRIAGNRIQTITVHDHKVFLGTDKGISVFSSK